MVLLLTEIFQNSLSLLLFLSARLRNMACFILPRYRKSRGTSHYTTVTKFQKFRDDGFDCATSLEEGIYLSIYLIWNGTVLEISDIGIVKYFLFRITKQSNFGSQTWSALLSTNPKGVFSSTDALTSINKSSPTANIFNRTVGFLYIEITGRVHLIYVYVYTKPLLLISFLGD